MGKKTFSRSIIKAGFLLLFVSLMMYFISRSIFLAFADYTVLEKVLAVIFLLAEVFVMLQAIGFFLQIYRLENNKKEFQKPQLKNTPPVAILIPARHEPKEVLETTLISCYNMRYPDKTIFLLDDSSDEKFMNEAEELAKKYGANLFRRAERHGAKAGIINDCIKTIDQKYFAVFDADQNPMPTFLSELVAIMEEDPKLALVQTPQFYSNTQSSKVAFASEMQQSVFYEYICEGKNIDQSMICCGTNVLLRRQAFLDVGGFDEDSVTEDFATSFLLHKKGWQTRYYNHVSTFGMGPEDLGSYFKQQNRWAMGNVGILRKILKDFFFSPRELSLMQWFDYIVTSSYYLIGWSYLFLVFCPVVYIFFSVPSFFMNPAVYTLTFFPYFFLSLAIFYATMGARHYTVGQMLKGQALLFITQPVFMKASFNGLLGIKGTFQVTSKEGGKTVPYTGLWPLLLFWAINLSAITWGANRFIYERTPAVLINVAWVMYHFVLLTTLFYFNEED